MSIASRTLAAAFAALIMIASVSAPAQARGGGHRGGHHHHHGHWGPGLFWAGIGLGIIGSRYYYYDYAQPGYPAYIVQRPIHYDDWPAPAVEPARPRAPDPIFYPRNGQNAGQTEADRQDCNRWAMAQPGAMAEASVFHRATLACMEGRGYVVR